MTAAPPSLFSIAWPMLAEALLGMSVGFVALSLAARGGDASSAAFALVNYVMGALQILLRVVAMGVSVAVTQQLGAGRRDAATAVARAALGASLWLGLTAAVVTGLAAGPLLHMMYAPPDVWPFAQPFLRLFAVVLVLDACHASLASVMRAHLQGRTSLAAILVMHAVHLALAVPLMVGAGRIPALGLTGFAIAAVIGRATGVALHLWLWRRMLGIAPRRSDWWRLDRRLLGPIARIGLPGAGENLIHWLAFMISVAAAGSLGARALAIHSYVIQIANVVLLYGMTSGFATEIMVGHLIGARQLVRADRLAATCLGRGVRVSVALAAAVAVAAPWLLRCFTQDPEILEPAQVLLWLAVVHEPARNFNFVYGNALRAAGDVNFPVLAGAISMAVVLAGGSWLFSRVLGLGLPGIWIAYIANEWLRGLVMYARWRTRRWVTSARAVHRHLLPYAKDHPR